MDGRGWIGRHGFWPLALLWLPAGVVAQAAVRFGPDAVAVGTPGPWLAAMAMEHNAELHTYDRGFARFTGLKWRNPLVNG